MEKQIIENVTFNDIHGLMNSGKNLTEKVVLLAENKEYIGYLVSDLIERDNSYLYRLISMVMSDYVESIIRDYKQNGENINYSSNLVDLYIDKIITVVSHDVVSLYYKLFHTQNEAEYFISLLQTAIRSTLYDYHTLVENFLEEISNMNYDDAKSNLADMTFFLDESINTFIEEFFDDSTKYEDNDDLIDKAYSLLEKILIAIVSNVTQDVQYLEAIYMRDDILERE